MRKFLPILVLIFFACKKNNDSSKTPANLVYDSLVSQNHSFYRLDVNADHIPDLKLEWWQQPFQLNVKTSYAVALHGQVKIHSTQQSVPICRDTTGTAPWQIVNTYNCTGGPNQFRTDSYVATPNLDSASVYTTIVNDLADSVMIYRQTWLWDMPHTPYTYSEEIKYGFFMNAQSGFLLFKLNEKRYALKLSGGAYMLRIENLVQIDP